MQLHLEPNDSYATMVQKTSKWAQNKNFYRLVEPVDRTEFGISSATVNAFYSSLKNGISKLYNVLNVFLKFNALR